MQLNELHVRNINFDELEKGKIHRVWLQLVRDGLGVPVSIPIIVAKGKFDGPTLGLTAAVHGNEINGIPVIQRLIHETDINKLHGTIVGVLVVNIPSLHRRERRFFDGKDLNHIMPGKKLGNVSDVYTYRFFEKVVKQFDYLLDLHTASGGRVNSYYIRANMQDEITMQLALLQNAQIVVDNHPSDGTLRGAASAIGIPAITLEVGNPDTFQRGIIRDGLTGMHNTLAYLKMNDCEIEISEKPVICKQSFWIYTDAGGILRVFPEVTDLVKKGERIATVRSIFGDLKKEYYAPVDGIVIGKEVHPINQTGGRLVHYGVI